MSYSSYRVSFGTSQTCLRVQERGALRPGERRTENGEQNARQARDWQATVRKSIAAAFYRVVQLARPSDVPGVQGELLPARAWGSAPHLPIS